MERFRRILLYVDPARGKTSAFERAVGLSRRSGAHLELLAVVPELSVYLRYPQFSYPSLEVTLRQEAEGRLAKLEASARAAGADVSAKVRRGKPFLEIAREALSGAFDLAMLFAEDENGRPASIAMHLFRVCPCPVWAVRPKHAGAYERILAPVDPSTPVEEEKGLNRDILDLALSLGEVEGARVEALHVWHGEPSVGRPVEELRNRIGEVAREAFSRLLAPYGSSFPDENVHLVEGDPAEKIVDFVGKNGVDLLVMGTLVRTGIAGFLIGNTAEKVLGEVGCSVLALKPRGFVSPLEGAPEHE